MRSGADAHVSLIRIMAAQQAHGPDSDSILDLGPVALGHHLLKITAEDAFERQPLSLSSDIGGKVTMVADARIYNRSALAGLLGLAKETASQLPDSAYVLHAWRRWGSDCVHHIIGAFAFAVWDADAEELFLARDHAGERPLYYCRSEGAFAFATSMRALLTCEGVSAELDEATLARDLVGLPPEPCRTRFQDVREVPPGHCLKMSARAPEQLPRRYWRYDALPPTRFARDEDYVLAFRELFDEAVRCRLRTTGGIASHLSAGLDSGAVTAVAARLLRGKRLLAFTAIPRPDFSGHAPRGCIPNEAPGARSVAELYPNIQHTLVDSSGSDVIRELERAFRLLERPLAAPLNHVWIALILDQAAAAGANVMLTGALGNATISYSGTDIVRRGFRTGHWITAIQQAIALRHAGMFSGRQTLSSLLSLLPWPLRSRLDPAIRNSQLADTAIRPRLARELGLFEAWRDFAFRGRTELPQMMETYFHTNILGEYNAMTNLGWRMESRDPTADKRIFEFCASIPLEQYMVGKPGRSLLRRAMRGQMPDEALDRRMRGLQAADWYESLTPIRAELAAELARLHTSPAARRLLDLDRLRNAVDTWPQNARAAAAEAQTYQMALPEGVAVGYFIRRSEELARSTQ
jgi:asparagine synthase (glutamine-hydrolysing)